MQSSPCSRFGVRACCLMIVMTLGACSHDPDLAFEFETRLLNLSSGYDSLDMYVDEAAADDRLASSADGRLVLADVGYGTISGYVPIEAGSYRVTLKKSGTTGAASSFHDSQLVKDKHTTYVAFGEPWNFAVSRIDEDHDLPDPGRAAARVILAAGAGTVDVYLTEPDAQLRDQAPLAAALDAGARSALVKVDAGEYRVRVTGSGDMRDLRLDAAGVVLADEAVVSLVLTDVRGGVLLDLIQLPQEEEPSVIPNTMARVRAAHAVSGAAAMGASVGGVVLLSSATPGTLGEYQLVDAGPSRAELSIDGTPVSIPDQLLVPGGDHTLLAWGDADGVRITLLEDDNRPPVNRGMSKLRLVNGISGVDGPINLYTDYYPVATGIGLGEASAYAEVYSGHDVLLDVLDTASAAALWHDEEVNLADGGVYTLLMTGQVGGPIHGALRRDR